MSLPGSPPGGPLREVTPDRANQQRDGNVFSSRPDARDSPVHDKIREFNNMSVTSQAKQLDRKAADAALKRAMLGREEAETELRRHKEEVKALQRTIEDGKARERKVGERLEAVMEKYGRAKETHAHTQALWEKEIRRARKDTFKSQSTNVKVQEELKSSRASVKLLEDSVRQEKERNQASEQEAFAARYQLVCVQEKLDEAMERIKVVEQERDAYKVAAKNEEVARIAAEGRIPLPKCSPDDEFASPNKKRKSNQASRVSLSTMDMTISMTTEIEMEELAQQVTWEKQRAERAQEMIEFLQAECQMNCCPCSKSKHRASLMASRSRRSSTEVPQQTPVEAPVSVDEQGVECEGKGMPDVEYEKEEEAPPEVDVMTDADTVEMNAATPEPEPLHEEPTPRQAVLQPPRSKKEPRRSTIFCPEEGVFRTVSEQEAEALEARNEAIVSRPSPSPAEVAFFPENEEEHYEEAATTADEEAIHHEPEDETEGEDEEVATVNNRMYARTPSVDPPAFAVLGQERVSLLSLINAPLHDTHNSGAAVVRLLPEPPLPAPTEVPLPNDTVHRSASTSSSSSSSSRRGGPARSQLMNASTSSYTVTTTTTVPIKGDDARSSSTFSEKLRTPSGGSNCSFDTTNPALTPTMTREEALAKIRERRGRAQSAAQAAGAASKKLTGATASSARNGSASGPRRDVSAPSGRAVSRTR